MKDRFINFFLILNDQLRFKPAVKKEALRVARMDFVV